jgi:hypothetical protein
VKFFSAINLKNGRFGATFPIGFDRQFISILGDMNDSEAYYSLSSFFHLMDMSIGVRGLGKEH